MRNEERNRIDPLSTQSHYVVSIYSNSITGLFGNICLFYNFSTTQARIRNPDAGAPMVVISVIRHTSPWYCGLYLAPTNASDTDGDPL